MPFLRLTLIALLGLLLCDSAQARNRGAVRQQESSDETATTLRSLPEGLDKETFCAIARPRFCDMSQAIQRGLFETGLRPQFPDNTECRDIDEHYAISYSHKRSRENYHGGIDMPAPYGTPMLAAADGEVVGIYDDDNSPRGFEVILRHSPEDTGLPVWVYTQYAHFDELPKLQIRQRVKMGQDLGPTGNSGLNEKTGQQSTHRRPAIHFAAFFSKDSRYAETMKTVVPFDAYWMDPVALYRKAPPFDSNAMKALPESEKRVPIAVMFEDGSLSLTGARLIWPYACKRK